MLKELFEFWLLVLLLAGSPALLPKEWFAREKGKEGLRLEQPKRLTPDDAPELLKKLARNIPHETELLKKCLLHIGEPALPSVVRAFDENIKLNHRFILNLCDILGKIGTSAAVPPLRKALAHGWEEVERKAIEGLEKIRDPSVVEEIEKILAEGKKSVEIRKDAARCLFSIGTEKAFYALSKRLYDENRDVRLLAIELLGKSKDARLVKTLEKIMKKAEKEEEPFLFMQAKEALINLGKDDLLKDLEKDLDQPEYTLCNKAIELLLRHKGKKAFESISQKVYSDNFEIKRAAVKALEELGMPEGIAFIEELTGSIAFDVRCEAFEALYSLGRKEVLDSSFKKLQSGDYFEREEAIHFFNRFTMKEAVPELIQAGKTVQNVNQKRRIIEPLGKIGDERAMPFLLEVLESETGLMETKMPFRIVTANVIADFGDRACEPVERLFREASNAQMKLAAIDILGRIGTPEAASRLRNLFADVEDENLRKSIKYWVERIELFL